MKHILNNATLGTELPWVTLDSEGIVHYSGLTVEDPLAALFNGYEAVDLGLTTDNGNHLLFAVCNVGATKPEEYGLLFQWGATEGHDYNTDAKDYSTWATAPFNNGSADYDEGYFSTVNGTVCPNGVLASQNDAAAANMGGNWRMPTKTELQALTALTNTWTTENRVNGIKFTASNGNYIFIPASGYANDGSVYNRGTFGFVWSSSLNADNPYYAYDLKFRDVGGGVHYYKRYSGFSVRGVLELTPEQYQLYLNK